MPENKDNSTINTADAPPRDANPLGTQPVGALIRKFSVPAIISMLVNAVYNIVDQIFIGQGIDMLGIAATNIIFPVVTLCTAVALLCGIGGASNFNIKMGEGDNETAGWVIGNAITLLVVFGVSIGLVQLVFARPLLLLLGATPAIMKYAIPYTIITAFGVPFLIFSTGASHIIRADSSPRYAMVCMLAGAIFNLVFDPVFLFIFHMGIDGIALATTLGQVLSFLLALKYIIRDYSTVKLSRSLLRLKWRYVAAIFTLGIASFFNQIAMALVQFTMNKSLTYYGGLSDYGPDVPLTAVGAISKVSFIFFSVSVGIAQGCQPIIGFNYGAKKYARVQQTLKLALLFASLTSILAFLMFQLFPAQIIALFGTPDQTLLTFATRYMRIFLFMMFVNGIQPVTSNFFTSIGKARIGIFISMTRQVIFFLPLVLILPIYFGIDGILYSGPIADAVAAGLSFIMIMREMRLLTKMEQELALQQ